METMYKNLNKKILLKGIHCVLLLFCASVQAQEVLPLTLEKVLELGGANNLTIKEFQEKQQLAAANLDKAREWWLPSVYAGVQTHQLWGASMNSDGRFFLDVNRQSLWNGIGLNAKWNAAEGIYTKKAAENLTKASVYESQAARNEALLESIKAYYDLLTAQVKLASYQNMISQSDTILQQIEIQVNAGLRYQSELLLAKSNHNHLRVEMLNVQADFNGKAAQLVRLLNLDSKTKLISAEMLIVPLDFQEELSAPSDTAYKNRPELKSLDFNIQSLKASRKNITTGLLIPQLSVGMYGSYFGRINGVVKPMFPLQYPETKQLYPTQSLDVSLLWNIPLGRLVYGGDLKKINSRIKIQEIKSAQLQAKINEEILISSQQLLIGKEQMLIAGEALQLAKEALAQSVERQKSGTAKPFEVFQAQQFFLQAQLDYLRSVSEYNKSQYALKVAKGENL